MKLTKEETIGQVYGLVERITAKPTYCDSDNCFKLMLGIQEEVKDMLSGNNMITFDLTDSECEMLKERLLVKSVIHIMLDEDTTSVKGDHDLKVFEKKIGGYYFRASLGWDDGTWAITNHNYPHWDVHALIENTEMIDHDYESAFKQISAPRDHYKQITFDVMPKMMVDLFKQISSKMGILVMVHLPPTNMPSSAIEAEFMEPDAFYPKKGEK